MVMTTATLPVMVTTTAIAMLPALEKNLEKDSEPERHLEEDLGKETVPEHWLQPKFLQWHLVKTPMPGPGRLTRGVADDCA